MSWRLQPLAQDFGPHEGIGRILSLYCMEGAQEQIMPVTELG
jgi:hypothetical protein